MWHVWHDAREFLGLPDAEGRKMANTWCNLCGQMHEGSACPPRYGTSMPGDLAARDALWCSALRMIDPRDAEMVLREFNRMRPDA